MSEAKKSKIYITDTILRDAHQSLAATRMRTQDMLPACQYLDAAGYWSVECWGGATFDACLRFLNEDPWDRLRLLKKALPHTKLQMLLRGQNLLGYKNYADDVVEAFVAKSVENGIDVVRVFDALNDTRNMEKAMKSIKNCGAVCEACMSYTVSPIHNREYFVNMAKKLEQMGADTVCIKDMAGLLLPSEAYELVSDLKKNISIPIHLHTHNTTGIGSMTYLMAALAGVDIIDCALSPFSGGSSQPSTESMVVALNGTSRSTELDMEQVAHASEYFKGIEEKLKNSGDLNPDIYRTDPSALRSQIPGGMLSNLISQLKMLGAEDKLGEVLREVPEVRKDFGYPPLVTPTSQIVGAQAVSNVISGKRYYIFTKEAKILLAGGYGRLPGDVDVKVREKAIGEQEVISCRPADLLPPEMNKLRNALTEITYSEEDVLTYAMFQQVALEFFSRRNNKNVREVVVRWNDGIQK